AEGEQRRAGAGGGEVDGAGEELVGVGRGEAAAGVGEAGPVQRDLGAGGRGGQGAIGGRGLVQEDGGRGGGGDVAGGVLVPGVDGLAAIAAGEGIGQAAVIVRARGDGSPARGRSRRGGG